MDRYLIDVDLRFAPMANHTADYINAHRYDEKTPPASAKDYIPSSAKGREKRASEFRRLRQIKNFQDLREMDADRKKRK